MTYDLRMLSRFYISSVYPVSFLLYGIVILACGVFISNFAFNWGFIDDFALIDWYNEAFVLQRMSLKEFVTLSDNSHLVAAPVVVSSIIFYIFGINFKILIYFSWLLILLGSILITSLLQNDLTSRTAKSLALLIPLIVMFHPVQIPALLWAFEIAWFMITFLLVTNVFVLERFGQRALPWIVVGCVVASFSSAHGVFLWLAAALHLALRPDLRHRWIWSAVFFVGFCLGVLLVLTLTAPESGGIRQGLQPSDALRIAYYAVGLIGSVFGSRIPAALIMLGGMGLILVAVWCWRVWGKRPLRAGERAGVVLIAASLLFVASFALGRFHFGLPWALAEYHAGPFSVPLLCGLCLLSLEDFDRSAGATARWTALIPCAFCLVSVIAFLPQVLPLGTEGLVRRALAMHESCAPNTPRFMLERLNGLNTNSPLLDRTLPIARQLCTTDEPAILHRFVAQPELFRNLASAHPDDAEALSDLWNVYRTHLDLMRAIPVDSPRMAERLLLFAHNDALGGSKYDPALLGRHGATFRRMGSGE